MGEIEGKVITVGVTGASGAILAQATLRLREADPRVARVHLVVTETGQRLFAHELGIVTTDGNELPALILGGASRKMELLSNRDVGALRSLPAAIR
ncbi:MAG TPA: flavoprotein [Candidatus Acidoferrales bacterium]|nr:flavoprotein [Candidatus Acidoferrales bacterium]